MEMSMEEHNGAKTLCRAYLSTGYQKRLSWDSRGVILDRMRVNPESRESTWMFLTRDIVPWVSPIYSDVSEKDQVEGRHSAFNPWEFQVVKRPDVPRGWPLFQVRDKYFFIRRVPPKDDLFYPVSPVIDLRKISPIRDLIQAAEQTPLKVGDLITAYEPGYHRVVSIGGMNTGGALTRPVKMRKLLHTNFSISTPNNHVCDHMHCKIVDEATIERSRQKVYGEIERLQAQIGNLVHAWRGG